MIGTGRWREVDRIFEAALDLPPVQRPAWLDEACAGQPEIRQAVERLLAADARRNSFLDQQPGEILASELAPSPGEGDRLGPYRLLRLLGRGGMGTVYLATRDDDPDERQVAVKILHAGLEGTQLRYRFLAERQILAQLDHPGIARLYTVGGTEDGRPYLVMERIEGEPLDVYCDRHRLTVDQRLALFRKICAAVEHAHRHLLVHRDLKPANILVTPEGEPKLLDFGIAKQLAPAETDPRTRTGLRVMTPNYASPEQVKGEAITTASDVYSLGVLLYELLCGRGPYPVREDAPTYETERAICELEPERPSEALFRAGGPTPETLAASRGSRPGALHRRLAGDLDNIVLKALRKEPAQRYESVSRLSSDLDLHLRSLPVSARPDTWGYRTRKLLRRHRAAAALTAVVLFLLIGLASSRLAERQQIARQRDKAQLALSFLIDTFKMADSHHVLGERLTAREVLDQGAERVSRELAGQPEVQAAVMDAIGEVNLSLGRNRQAAPMLEKALELRRRALSPSSLEMAESLRHLAELRLAQSDFAGAEALLRQALAIERRRLGEPSVEVADTLNQLGETGTRKGDFRGAEPLHRQALAIALRAGGPEGRLTVAESLLDLARCRDQSGDYPAAETYYRQGLALEKQLLGERDPKFVRLQSAYGEMLVNEGKYPQAEAVFRRALAAQRQALGEDHPEVASILDDLAVTCQAQGDLQGAETLYRQALPGLRKGYGEVSSHVGDALANLGTLLEIEGRSTEAIPLHEEALAIRRQVYGEHHQVVGHSLLCLARTRRALRQLDAALPLARQSLAVIQTTLGPEHPLTAHPAEVVGMILQDQGKPKEAEPYLRQAAELLGRSVPPGHPKLAQIRVELATCLVSLNRLPEAESLLRQAEPLLTAQMGPDAGPVRQVKASLADIERRRKTLKPASAAPAQIASLRSTRSQE